MKSDTTSDLKPRVVVASAKLGVLECARHPGAPAVWRCLKCGAQLCDDCPEVELIGERPLRTCPVCEMPGRLTRISDEEQNPDLYKTLVRQAHLYPLQGFGPYVLVGSGLLSLIMYFTMDLVFADLVFGVLMTTFIGAYAVGVLNASSQAATEPPDWPDMTMAYESVVLPAVRLLLSTTLAFGPAVYFELNPMAGAVFLNPLAWLFGALAWPMAVLSTTLHGSIVALNPIFLFQSVARIPKAYLYTAGANGAALAIEVWVFKAIPTLGFISLIMTTAMLVYLLMVQMRILGLLYYAHRRHLGWFDEQAS